ncbi:hypothetical protein [Clavibacter phaseoli]|uniref:hypothetical protein n=1 Tax=Clavibacter phaseoli TaxID=1734031 RepID=UPI000E66E84E|nr:hypothetical protein [Clavibacter phaseoli]RII95487.1 hypothetical protein DZF95_00960 [Clavibacter michiganensis]UKF32436.1 hypothetical protein FGD69_14935 [Clavibacter phaseoli]UKF38447.1 hypothetical protein FGI33_14815 [Clavibacter phaseoli]
MTRDPLDELLDHSAPPSRPAAKHDLDAMIAEARQSAPRTARSRVLVAAGLAAAFTFGGVGIAAATDGLSWAPWAEDPIGTVQFTMGNGFQCELRFSEYTKGRDPSYVREVNSILESWYRTTDVLPIVQAIVPTRLAGLDPEDLEIGIGEPGEVLPPEEVERREWSRQWLAWDLAISDAEQDVLTAHGIQPGDERFAGSERSGQIKCRDESGEPYALGAES